MTNREMVNFQKRDFFRFFFIYYYKSCSTGARKRSIEYMVCIKINSSRNTCGLFSSVFKKIILYNTTLIFKKWVG